MASPTGHLVSGNRLQSVLRHERVFRTGSWDERQLRSVGYDLRMGKDRMVIPDETSLGKFKSYPPGKVRALPVLLKPGDTAFVSSEERISLAWNLAGNIGPKFALAAQGLLVLTGLMIDPGYGWEMEDGLLQQTDDTRLHFVLANVGARAIALQPGVTSIAVLELFEVTPVRNRQPVGSPGRQIFELDYFADVDQPVGLAFFRNVRDIAENVDQVRGRIDITDANVVSLANRVERVEVGANHVLVFGVYVLAATIFGVSLSVALHILESIDFAKFSGDMRWSLGAGLAALFLMTVILFAVGLNRLRKK